MHFYGYKKSQLTICGLLFSVGRVVVEVRMADSNSKKKQTEKCMQSNKQPNTSNTGARPKTIICCPKNDGALAQATTDASRKPDICLLQLEQFAAFSKALQQEAKKVEKQENCNFEHIKSLLVPYIGDDVEMRNTYTKLYCEVMSAFVLYVSFIVFAFF